MTSTLPLHSYEYQNSLLLLRLSLIMNLIRLRIFTLRTWWIGQILIRPYHKVTHSVETLSHSLWLLSASQALYLRNSYRAIIERASLLDIPAISQKIPQMKSVLTELEDNLLHIYGLDPHLDQDTLERIAAESDHSWEHDPRENEGMRIAIEEAATDPDENEALALRIKTLLGK